MAYLKAYKKRDELIRTLGYKTYKAYIASPLWKQIRTRYLNRHPQCYGCFNPSKQVHHGKYTIANLSGDSVEHLYAVCGRCHFKAEFTDDGAKRGPKKATKTLKKSRKNVVWTNEMFGRYILYGWDKIDPLDREYQQRLEREP